MFISRTVAAEVLMEAESNRAGYAALKTLDREGGLRFSLAYVSSHPLYDFIERTCISSLVEDLIKVGPSGTVSPDITQSTSLQSFIRFHSITTPSIGTSLGYLWKDFSSRDPVAQLVMLLTVFISCPKATADTLHSSLERLNLTPVSSEQIAHVLLSPFLEQFSSVLHYTRVYCEMGDDVTFSSFLADVAVRCLEISSKVFFLMSIYQAISHFGS